MVIIRYIATAFMIIYLSGEGQTAVINGVSFRDYYKTGNTTLKIKGVAVLRYKVIFNAYAGAFYLQEKISSSRALDDVHKRLELSYFYSIKAADFADATTEMIKRNVNLEDFNELKEKIKYFNSLYMDVNPGDRYSITYSPGNGTSLALNEKVLGTVKGELFAKAVFSIWIGRDPIDAAFKKNILGL